MFGCVRPLGPPTQRGWTEGIAAENYESSDLEVSPSSPSDQEFSSSAYPCFFQHALRLLNVVRDSWTQRGRLLHR